MRGNRIWRKLAPALLTLAALVAPATAQAGTAHLDSEFGTGGVILLPRSVNVETGIGLLEDGRVLVANRTEVWAFLPSGQPDLSFGQGGVAHFTVPTGTLGTVVNSVAVDGEGRAVGVGTAELEDPDPLLRSQEPFIERLTTEGQPDPTFGGGTGYDLGGFSLPPTPQGKPVDAYLGQLAFDSEGRIIVSGRTFVGEHLTKNGTRPYLKPFFARLEPSGSLDRSFSGHGSYLSKLLRPIPLWAVDPQNQLVVEGLQGIYRLQEDGRRDRDFGKNGRLPYLEDVGAAPPQIDPKGRLVFFRSLLPVKDEQPGGFVIRRLGPDGSPDRSFGNDGLVRQRIPGVRKIEMGFDEQGRILLLGNANPRGRAGGRELLLIRLRQSGVIDRSFGHDGILHIHFPGRPEVYVWQVAEGVVVEGEKALLRIATCNAMEGCRPTVALVDLGTG